MDALFAVEGGDAFGAGGYGLAGAGFDAELGFATLTEVGVLERHVVGEAGGGLDFASD